VYPVSIPPFTAFLADWRTESDARRARSIIAAMANSKGGDLYVGMQESGEIPGLSDPKDALKRLNRALEKDLSPALDDFVSARLLDADGRKILRISVKKGRCPPYYSGADDAARVLLWEKNKIRIASNAEVARMIVKNAPLPYLAGNAREKNLTFAAFTAFLRERSLPEALPLSFWNPVFGCYTKLALAFSDQSATRIILEGPDEDDPEYRTVTGSLVTLFAQARAFLAVHAKALGIPTAVTDEALINLLLHSDYSSSWPPVITAAPGAVTFANSGGTDAATLFRPDKSAEADFRNPGLLEIFKEAGLARGRHTGIRRIQECYEKADVEGPEGEFSPNFFTLTLAAMTKSSE
jgi:ATP-dependent DNA helicase RecG